MEMTVSYESQFNRIYDARINELRTGIAKSSVEQGRTRVLNSILEVEGLNGGECVVIGTLYISSDLKSSIFDMVGRRSKDVEKVGRFTYYSRDVRYFLEDGSGRIELELRDSGEIYRRHFVVSTGMCVGVVGRQSETGTFIADDLVLPFSSPRRIPDVPEKNAVNGRICFASGVLVDADSCVARMKVIIDYLRRGGVKEYFLIGNFFESRSEVSKNMLASLGDVVRYTGANVRLIPNKGDFGARVLPLVPVHPKLIDAAVECLSNPCRVDMNGKEGLVITQFIIDDLLKYMPRNIGSIQGEGFEYKMHVNESELKRVVRNEKQDLDAQHTLNTIHAMEVLMKAGHICPTAPDTLACAPFCEQDPFVITNRMEYVCCGDAPGFASRRSDSEGSLFFTIPRFSNQHEVVVLSTEDGTLETIRFDQEEFD